MRAFVRPALARGLQRGVSMLFALCALVVLTLGGVALLRSSDTGLLILGNLGLKRDAVAASSVGAEAAIAWLTDKGAGILLNTDQPKLGYYATAHPGLDPTGSSIATSAASLILVDWNGNGCTDAGVGGRVAAGNCLKPTTQPTQNGNKILYVITRLCANPGPVPGNDCVKPGGKSTQDALSAGYYDYANPRAGALAFQGTFYRVITRTVGTKSTRFTVSLTETLVHF